jgi:hypothetical protein
MALPSDKFNQPEDVASEPFGWKADTQAHSVPLPDTEGMEVDEVHQFDAPYGGRASLKHGPVNATGQSGKDRM